VVDAAGHGHELENLGASLVFSRFGSVGTVSDNRTDTLRKENVTGAIVFGTRNADYCTRF